MAEGRQFRMVNDQTGEETTATLETFAEASGKGFRVASGADFDAAVQERKTAEQEAIRAALPVNDDLHNQTNADAALTVSKRYPDAEQGDDAPENMPEDTEASGQKMAEKGAKQLAEAREEEAKAAAQARANEAARAEAAANQQRNRRNR